MATIYRFIVENKVKNGSGRKETGESKKGSGKRATSTLLGSPKGGVEHNRYLRAINPVLNKMTGGVWEKGMRVGRAGLGLARFYKDTGAFAGLSAVAITIIISFVLQTLLQWQNSERQKAQKLNTQNYKSLENGYNAIHGAYDLVSNTFNGRLKYNENK